MHLIFLVLLSLLVTPGFARNYSVGPDYPYERLIDVPTFELEAGDTVKVFAKDEPYYEKILLHGVGTEEEPIVLMGYPDENGNKPILDGRDAISSLEYSYWNDPRQIILVGQYEPLQSDHIIIDGFEIRNANMQYEYTDDHRNVVRYAENACAIRAEYCGHLTIRNCDLHNCANGFQNTETDIEQYVLLEKCHIHDNGDGGDPDRYLEHNIYVMGRDIHLTVQFCHFGELLNDGQQLKTRAETNVIRYNWIDGGRNSQLDMVDSDYGEGVEANAWVYGNVIIKPPDVHNSRFIHFGGERSNRKGTLYFYNNTCIINSDRHRGTRRLFEISQDSSRVIADNNIFYMYDDPYQLWARNPNITGSNNWLSDIAHGDSLLEGSLHGENPGFVGYDDEDFHLLEDSPCIDVVENYEFPEGHELLYQYVPHLDFEDRPITNGLLDIGAFYFPNQEEDGVHDPSDEPVPGRFRIVAAYPNPFNNQLNVRIHNPLTGIVKANLIDLRGRVVFERSFRCTTGMQTINVHTQDFIPAGSYVLVLSAGGASVVSGVVLLK